MTTWTEESNSTKRKINTNNYYESLNRPPLSICNSFRSLEFSAKFLRSRRPSAQNLFFELFDPACLAQLRTSGVLHPQISQTASRGECLAMSLANALMSGVYRPNLHQGDYPHRVRIGHREISMRMASWTWPWPTITAIKAER
jgi:hypothetical protein